MLLAIYKKDEDCYADADGVSDQGANPPGKIKKDELLENS
jgi:hypothetical protein